MKKLTFCKNVFYSLGPNEIKRRMMSGEIELVRTYVPEERDGTVYYVDDNKDFFQRESARGWVIECHIVNDKAGTSVFYAFSYDKLTWLLWLIECVLLACLSIVAIILLTVYVRNWYQNAACWIGILIFVLVQALPFAEFFLSSRAFSAMFVHKMGRRMK